VADSNDNQNDSPQLDEALAKSLASLDKWAARGKWFYVGWTAGFFGLIWLGGFLVLKLIVARAGPGGLGAGFDIGLIVALPVFLGMGAVAGAQTFANVIRMAAEVRSGACAAEPKEMREVRVLLGSGGVILFITMVAVMFIQHFSRETMLFVVMAAIAGSVVEFWAATKATVFHFNLPLSERGRKYFPAVMPWWFFWFASSLSLFASVFALVLAFKNRA
jgi:hypothetical protein